MSASSSPTRAPDRCSAAARLTATVDLPTPPLPLATAIVCFTPGSISDGCRMKPGRTLAVIFTATADTPSSAPTDSSAWVLKRSRTGHAGVVSSNVNATSPALEMRRSLIMPRLTTSRPRSGSTIVDRAARICCSLGAGMATSILSSRRPRTGCTLDFWGSVTPYIADFLEYCQGPASDIYFQRAADTLAAAGLDPVVTMEYFGDRDGVLCGMRDVLDLLRRSLAGRGEAWALDDGSPIAAREVVMRVRAPYSRFGRLETALLGMLASCSGWATAARAVVEAAGGTPVISFGARHVHPLVGPVMEYAAVVGGCVGCATPLGAQLAGLPGASGTMPHAMILIFGDTVEAGLAFDRTMPENVLRVVLVDT